MKKIIKETLKDGRVQYKARINVRTHCHVPIPYIECFFSSLEEAKRFLCGYDGKVVEKHEVLVVSE